MMFGESETTWRQKKHLVQCRLVFWLISDELYEFVKDTSICCAPNSDHSAISLTFEEISSGIKGRGYWKFNSSLLSDEKIRR